VQRASVDAFAMLINEHPDARDAMRDFHAYAVRHRDIVERFGRYPHRNAILQRASTPEEVEFLKQPGSRF
jgi:uncharacterized protein (DUF924 family)